MTDVLLISNSLPNINIAWRHFCYREYNASATASVDTAMEYLRSDKPPQVVIYYCGGSCSDFFPFYRILREDEKSAKLPLVILTDVEFQKALSEYVKLENTQVLGISVDDKRLMDVIRGAAKNPGSSQRNNDRRNSDRRNSGSRNDDKWKIKW